METKKRKIPTTRSSKEKDFQALSMSGPRKNIKRKIPKKKSDNQESDDDQVVVLESSTTPEGNNSIYFSYYLLNMLKVFAISTILIFRQ
jgi:hypothetical protein